MAFLCSNAIIESSKTYLDEEKKNAVSVLRIAKIMTFIGEYILKYIINKTEECLSVLKRKIKLFSNEIYDPNFKRRRTSIAILMDMCTLEKQNP